MGYKYKLRAEEAKIRKFVVELNDEEMTRRHAIGAAVCTTISDSTEEELKKGETKVETSTPEESDDESDVEYEGIKNRILDYARKELTPWGYRIAKIEWLQRTPSKTYRIMQDSAPAATILPEDEEE